MSSEILGLCISVFIAGFLCTQYLSHVLTLDSLATFLAAAWVGIFSRDWMSSISTDYPIDALHEYLTVITMSAMMVPALVWFLNTDPGDISLRTALAISRFVGFGLGVIVTLLEHYKVGIIIVKTGDKEAEQSDSKNTFSYTGYLYGLLPMSTLAFVYGMHLFYTSRVSTYARYGQLNLYIHADLMLTSIAGFMCIVFPNIIAPHFGRTIDRLHIYMLRMFGVMYFANAGLPWLAPRFRSVANRRAVLFSKALTLLVCIMVTFCNVRNGRFPEDSGSRMLVVFLFIMTIPPAIGSMRHDQGSQWDYPWRGLRVPDVPHVHGANDIYNMAYQDLKKATVRTVRKVKAATKGAKAKFKSKSKSKSRSRSKSKKRR